MKQQAEVTKWQGRIRVGGAYQNNRGKSRIRVIKQGQGQTLGRKYQREKSNLQNENRVKHNISLRDRRLGRSDH